MVGCDNLGAVVSVKCMLVETVCVSNQFDSATGTGSSAVCTPKRWAVRVM